MGVIAGKSRYRIRITSRERRSLLPYFESNTRSQYLHSLILML